MVGMQDFQDTFKTPKQPFIKAFSICMTVSLIWLPKDLTA